jgi:signal transduction histidine kinase
MKMKSAILMSLLLCVLGVLRLISQNSDTLNKQAGRFYFQNKYDLAQEKYLQAIKKAEEENKPTLAALSSMSLARCYYFLYDHPSAFKWSYYALNTVQKHKIDSLTSRACYFLGVLYIEDEKVDSAEKYSLKAAELFMQEKKYARLSQTYSTLGELYLNTSKDTLRVKEAIANAGRYAVLSGDKSMMAFAESKWYNYYFFYKKDYPQALMHVNEAEKLYHESGNREAILNAYRAKAECLIVLRDTSARTYMLKWFSFKDSILQAEKSANIAKYELLYETEKKEKENKILHQEIELHRLLLLIALAVVLLLIVLGLWLYNRNNLKKKQLELQMLKNLQSDKERIARDLHDNVGGQLSYIVYSLDGINDEDKEKRKEITESIYQSVRSVINSLRETIWAISDAGIKVQDFSDKLKVFSRNLFKHSDTQLFFVENISNERELNALLGLNMYRICQEILNNAFKHARAKKVKMILKNDETGLRISICDDGIGFDTGLTGKEQYGLQNIKKRAEEFGITFILETELNKGTCYTLTVVEGLGGK